MNGHTILVAIISVTGSLFGTIVGGSIVTGGTYLLTRRREISEFRTACRLVEAELLDAMCTVKLTIKSKTLWRPDEDFLTDSWKQHKHVLAQHLPLRAWDDVRMAAEAVESANFLAASYRSLDLINESFSDAATESFTSLRSVIETGYVYFRPYLL
jgi:hypothetical protein